MLPTQNGRLYRYKKRISNVSGLLALAFLLALLSGCGGGGGGGAAPAPGGSSNWDQMTWGQDNWA